MISKKVESSLADNHHTTKIKRSPNITFYNQISFIFRTVFSVSQYNFLQFNIFYFQDCVFRLAGTSEDNTEGKGRQGGQILAAEVASSLGKGKKSWGWVAFQIFSLGFSQRATEEAGRRGLLWDESSPKASCEVEPDNQDREEEEIWKQH